MLIKILFDGNSFFLFISMNMNKFNYIENLEFQESFELSELMVNTGQHPKNEVFHDYIFIVLKMLRIDDK